MVQKIELKQRDIKFAFLISGLFGFCLGVLHSYYQVVVDNAQVLAGIVKYPHNNPYYVFSVKGWTILVQLTALFMRLGVSERLLSFLWSGIIGMVSFQALTLGVLALSSNVIFSILSSFLIFFIHDVWSTGFTYPISLLGTMGTFGTMSLSFPFLVITLIALGQYRLGGLLLGLAPAIHPTHGSLCNVVVIVSLVWGFRKQNSFPKDFLKCLLLGYVITGVSLAYQLSIYDVPKINPILLSKYKYALIVYWSGEHFMKFKWLSGAMARVILSLILSIWGLLSVKSFLSSAALFILRSFIVSALLAAALSFVYWLPPEMIVDKFYNLLTIQPARLFNYNLLGSLVLLLGLLWYFRGYYWVKFNLTILVILLTFYKIIYNMLPYNTVYGMPTNHFTIGLVFASTLALILSLPPFEVDSENSSTRKSAWLKLNISAIAIAIFYSFTPVFQGDSFVALMVIFISTIALALSIIFLEQKASINNYHRVLFITEALFLAISGLLWIFTKSGNPVYFGKYSLARLLGIPFIYILAFIILILPYLQLHKFTTDISQPFKKIRFLYLDRIIFLVLGLAVLLTFINAGYSFQDNLKTQFQDYTNNRFYAELYKGYGMILPGPGALSWIMPRSRRPVLYYGTPNNLVYSIEAGPEFDRIFKEVYGVDLLNPPQESLTTGLNLPKESVRILWESRTLEQWRQIKKEFDVSDIVTLADWKLKLPEVMRDDKFVLYKIP